MQNVVLIASGSSAVAQDVSSRGLLDTSDINGKWEGSKTAAISNPSTPSVENTFAIIGSDTRAGIFGTHNLAEQCEQPAFRWWLDTPTKQHSEMYALPHVEVSVEPAIEYRWLFINDEAPATMQWWSTADGVDHKKFGTEYYKYVVDMLLHSKAGYIWPAMWASFAPQPGSIFFTDDPYNQLLAGQLYY